MKLNIKYLFLIITLSCSLNLYAQITAAEVLAWKGGDALVRVTFAHLADRLVIKKVATHLIAGDYYFDVEIGTTRRPVMLHSCLVVSVDNEGMDFISKIEQHWDQSCSSLF